MDLLDRLTSKYELDLLIWRFCQFDEIFSMVQKSNIIQNPTTIGCVIETAHSRPPSGKSRNSEVVRGRQKCLEKFSANTFNGEYSCLTASSRTLRMIETLINILYQSKIFFIYSFFAGNFAK